MTFAELSGICSLRFGAETSMRYFGFVSRYCIQKSKNYDSASFKVIFSSSI
jgi:hypothetical protein